MYYRLLQQVPSSGAAQPHNPTGSGNNNKTSPKVSVSKPPGPGQVPDKPQDTTEETTTLHRSNRVRKPNKRYADTLNIASVVKNNLWLWSKTPPKGTVHMLAKDLIYASKVVFIKFGLPKKFVLEAGTHFVSNS